MRKLAFVNGGIYHIYNRGVEKLPVFHDSHDCFRFLYGLYEFNDKNPAENIYFKEPSLKSYEAEPRRELILKDREQVVHIYAYCLIDNHFHLMARQIEEGGIVKFMHKLGTGYTGFSNKKYERSGHLFQGRFKAVSIEKESQLLYLPYYIHANTLDMYMPGWREDGVANLNKAMQILENYEYSSYSEYACEQGNYRNPILEKDFLSGVLGSPEQYKKDMMKWLKEKNRFEKLGGVTIES
ncbi:hypothetical protein A2755_03390 [Candidatus Wolfebacteria bacterium RIFCSPHIGHO2_01_FULL_48_22]|uniref:Transposase IS200-like domain-containing protein n=2 Tax=Candidatus Wolfeibacteriota TaxID=1752735 RepID=A0A1F8DPM5_9BACT|nr:MAG: hypothetical protein A2755_03390 [Candidatus Wolfebacteria bacterium RIFCSPHIGHO2_01_FULL_48_22]OGM92071.1 MAG: hypothetical protein A2935_01880 [Candidatus Wolfebacteria bacterium RIFCSPLOWO2_01_FULL_47_17b]